MLFNSLEFAVFLPIVFILYWFVTARYLKLQNLVLLLASYFFYGWWDWRFLALIFFSSTVDYVIGIQLGKDFPTRTRKVLLALSIAVNIGFLGFFKYYNFFSESFADAFTLLGAPFEPSRLNIILPVGISFYTFQTLSYSLDVYRRKLTPTKDSLAFFAFVSFFPQLVAGPIERASNLLPQFFKKRSFNEIKATDGLRQILIGLFKKVIVADHCAMYVNEIFNNHQEFSGSTLFLGAVFFAFQIYGDFSGYSDIAIGTARLFGFNLMKNFAFPYFSRDIAEFWRRWHISLSTWFRDYLYIPLGGSRGSTLMKVRNIFIIFLVSGFWHGANWTFLVWGGLNALYFLPLMLSNKNRKNIDSIGTFFPSLREFLQMGFTFLITVIAWIFFRAESVHHALDYLKRMLSDTLFSIPTLRPSDVMLYILILVVVEWFGREKEHALQNLEKYVGRPLRWLVYFAIAMVILLYSGEEQEFIYFQF